MFFAGSRWALSILWICCSRRVCPCLRSLFWFLREVVVVTSVVTKSFSCLTSFVRISTVLRMALLVAMAAWALSWCWRMEPLSPKLVKVGLDRGSRRRRLALGVSFVFPSMLSLSSVVEAVEEGAGAFGFGSSTSRSVSVSGSSFEYMGLARLLFFCRILGVLVNIAGGARVWSVLGLVTECSGFPLARGSSLYRTSGAVGACRDLSRLLDILWGGAWLLCRCLVVFGGELFGVPCVSSARQQDSQ